MTTELHERLAGLASVTPATSPPPDLWPRGVRRRRVVAAGRTAVVAVLVLMVGLGGWAWHQTRPVEPADTHGTPHLPDGFYTPRPWLPSFDGPPGPLVAVGVAERKSLFHTTEAVYGVIASDSRYGFLALPPDVVVSRDVPSEVSPAPSPDGRHVALWTAGASSGDPNTDQVGATITGVAVYDTVTGALRRHPIATRHGIVPSDLVWSDDQTLVLAYGQAEAGDHGNIDARSGSTDNALYTWRPSSDAEPTRVGRDYVDTTTRAGSGRLIVSVTDRRVAVYGTGAGTRHVYSLSHAVRAAVLAGDHRSLVTDDGGGGRHLWTGLLPAHAIGRSRVDLRRVPIAGIPLDIIGWSDLTHVVLMENAPARSGDYRARVVSVDVRTGVESVLVHSSASESGPLGGAQLAVGLLGAPSSSGVGPPNPMDRRWLLGGSLAVLLVVGLYLWGATRGRRA